MAQSLFRRLPSQSFRTSIVAKRKSISAAGLGSTSRHSIRRDRQLWRVGEIAWHFSPSHWQRCWPQPYRHHHPLPPRRWSKRTTHGFCRRHREKNLAFGTRKKGPKPLLKLNCNSRLVATFATTAAAFAVAVVAAAATTIVEIFIRCFTDIDDFA